jgi:phospholipid/cholesterol/gamma-HCH transport system substrate-binding protein
MPIGKVRELKLTESESCSGVCVTLMLDNKLTMHEGYEIKIISTSILGGRQLHIDEGPFDAEVADLEIYRGKDPYDIMEDAADIVNAARSEIIAGSVFKNIRNITDHINDMVMRVNKGEGLLGAVLSDEASLTRDINSSMKSMRVVLNRVEEGKGFVGQLLAEDSGLHGDLEASMTAMRKILERVEQGDGTIGKLVSADATLYSDLSDAVASLKNIAERIDKGEGTIGRFVSDDTLYNEVEATVGEIRATIDDFRETAPITAFSSIFFGAF